MDERVYDGLIARYAPSWNAPAAAAGGAGRLAVAVDADGQTHQCRVSHCGLDPAGQHHDAGAARGTGASRAALSVAAGRECAVAATAPGRAAPPRWRQPKSRPRRTSRAPRHRSSLRRLRRLPAAPAPQRRMIDAFDSCRRRSLLSMVCTQQLGFPKQSRPVVRIMLNVGSCHFISSSLPSAASSSRNSRAGSPSACKPPRKGPAASPHSHHPDDAEARRRAAGRRLALLGDPGRNRRPRKDHRDRAVPRPRRYRTVPAGDAAQGDRGVCRGRCGRSRAGAISPKMPRRRISKSAGAGVAAMPEPLRRELRDLGLL